MVGSARCLRLRVAGRGVLILCSSFFVLSRMVASVEAGGRPGGKFGGLPSPSESEFLQVTPASVSFVDVPVGEKYTQIFQITNVTNASLRITRISASSPEFIILGVDAPLTIAPGARVTFTVEYRPRSAESVRAELVVETSVRDGSVTAALKGSAVRGELELDASAASLDFGEIPAGQRATKELILSNAGNTKLEISKVVVFGESFEISRGGEVSLAPGQTCTLAVDFNARSLALRSGTLSIFSSAPDSPLQIPLSGVALAPSSQAISLKWNGNQEGVSGYFVYRSTENGGPYTKLQDAALASAEFTDAGLAAGRTYYYVITSVDGNDIESNYSDQIIVTVPN